MSDPRPGAADQTREQRPTLVLIVYCWDMLLGILAIFGAFAALGGQVAVGTRLVTLPLALQILDAFASAAYAAVLIMTASLLTRPLVWIRRFQIATLAIAVGLAALSLLTAAVAGGLGIVPLLVTLLFMLLDVAAIVVMTEHRITSWYVQQAPTPLYATVTLGFWALSSLVLVVVDALQ
ncbi:MAG: hypothetical protein JOY80_11030 [Candidatus Dormibacteraeota bacterium]|nr:hypothetical protein [Candidatus Dormibacteraeota bacterium]